MTRRWRHGCLTLVVVLVVGWGTSPGAAQSRHRPPPRYLGGHQPDQAEGARILEDMRTIALVGSYYQEFELRVLPRKGDGRRIAGRSFGNVNAHGPITRIELFPTPTTPDVWLVQNGRQPTVWRLAAADGPAVAVQGADVLQPLAGTTLSAADLQIPFMYWTDFIFEGRERFRGRPAFIFLLFPPPEQAAAYPGIGGARVFLDTQYRAPLQAQWVNEAGDALKTITILDLKKLGESWIVKSFEVRDETTRDKTRFLVTAVALNVTLPDALFSPDGPAQSAPLNLAHGQLVPVD